MASLSLKRGWPHWPDTPSPHTLKWRHNGRDSFSSHKSRHCLLNRLFRRRSTLRVTGLCAGNSPVVGEFPAQMASNTEHVYIWWRHHANTDMKRNTTKKPSKSAYMVHNEYTKCTICKPSSGAHIFIIIIMISAKHGLTRQNEHTWCLALSN